MLFYRFWRGFFRIFLTVMGRWKVSGAHNLPKEGAVILVSNHKSNWDPVIAACAVNRYVSYMSKAELFDVPVLGKVLPWLGVFPIKRGKSDIAALRTALDLLSEGKILGMFPEGTRSKTEEMLKFKTGIAMLAYKAKCPIVPVALINSTHAHKGWFKPVKVIVGEAFIPEMPEGRASTEDLEKISAAIQQKVRQLLIG